MKVKVKKTGVTFENGILEIGTVLDVSEKDGKRLISGGYGELMEDTEPPKKTGRGKAVEK